MRALPQGVLGGLVTWISHGENTYRLASFTSEQKLGTFDDAFVTVTRSFRSVTDRAVLAVQPAKISLVRADRDMTLEEFQRRFPSTIPIEELAIANGLEQGATIPKGRTVKRIRGGELP